MRCSAGRLKPGLLAHILGIMVSKNLAVYEPAKQTRAVLLYWRLPEEWAEVLHEWVRVSLFPSHHNTQGGLCGSRLWPHPYLPCWGPVVFAGDVNGAAEHDLDVVRDRESSCVVCVVGDPRVATPQCDCDTRQERSSPTHQHSRWGRCTTLSAQCQVTGCSQRAVEPVSSFR